MQLAIVGLGKMGGNMARRLAPSGTELVLMDLDPAVAKKIAGDTKGSIAKDFSQLKNQLRAPRFVWLMVPSGSATQSAIDSVAHWYRVTRSWYCDARSCAPAKVFTWRRSIQASRS